MVKKIKRKIKANYKAQKTNKLKTYLNPVENASPFDLYYKYMREKRGQLSGLRESEI